MDFGREYNSERMKETIVNSTKRCPRVLAVNDDPDKAKSPLMFVTSGKPEFVNREEGMGVIFPAESMAWFNSEYSHYGNAVHSSINLNWHGNKALLEKWVKDTGIPAGGLLKPSWFKWEDTSFDLKNDDESNVLYSPTRLFYDVGEENMGLILGSVIFEKLSRYPVRLHSNCYRRNMSEAEVRTT